MEIKLYVDVYPGQSIETLYATADPPPLQANCKRFRITARIPDEAFMPRDGQVFADNVEEVKDADA
jgi:hypothetical protein